jgi:hypothetical protein
LFGHEFDEWGAPFLDALLEKYQGWKAPLFGIDLTVF